MPTERQPPAPAKVVELQLQAGLRKSRLPRVTNATVLFVDLRGYTGIAERFPAATMMRLLAEFCALLARAIETHGGEIYHIAGDGIMAGFGVDYGGAQGARESMGAAREMLRSFAALGNRWRDELSIETGIGVGIHQGEVALGLLGPTGRRTTTLVGDTVNVAARLCNRARAGEVLFSASVAAAIESEPATAPVADFLHLPELALRGRSRPLDIWCVPARERTAVGSAL